MTGTPPDSAVFLVLVLAGWLLPMFAIAGVWEWWEDRR